MSNVTIFFTKWWSLLVVGLLSTGVLLRDPPYLVSICKHTFACPIIATGKPIKKSQGRSVVLHVTIALPLHSDSDCEHNVNYGVCNKCKQILEKRDQKWIGVPTK